MRMVLLSGRRLQRNGAIVDWQVDDVADAPNMPVSYWFSSAIITTWLKRVEEGVDWTIVDEAATRMPVTERLRSRRVVASVTVRPICLVCF